MQALAERLDDFVSGRALRADRPARLLLAQDVRARRSRISHGQVLDGITRRGKYLVWTFGSGIRIVLHLSQAGRVDVESRQDDPAPGSGRPFHLLESDPAPLTPDGETQVERAVLVREHGRSARPRGGCWRRVTRGRWRDWGPSPTRRPSPS